MRFRSIIRWVVLVALIFGLRGPQTAAAARGVWVDPLVINNTQAGDSTPVLVVLRAQADLQSMAVDGRSWDARGWLVMDILQGIQAAAQTDLQAMLRSEGIPFRSYWIINAIALTADRALVDRLAARADVARIVSNAPFRVDLDAQVPSDMAPYPSRGVAPNLTQINAPDLWALGVTGQGMVIGVADTGVQWDHDALQAQYAGWDGSSADHAYHWWDAIHDDTLDGTVNSCGVNLTIPCDDYGHGTHVTGITVGDDGADHQIGVAPGAKWIACRNMDSGFGTPATYIECFQFFLAPTDLDGNNPDPAQRPHIVNNSFSCLESEGCTAKDELHDAVEALRAAGIFMAVAAGNGGPSCSTISTPPALEAGVFTIGAVNGTDLIAGFSSRGPVTVDGSGRMKPDLVAPGVLILSSTYNGGYGYKSGTSMAAPHVAGGVALLWSAFPGLVRDIDSTEWLLRDSAFPRYCGTDCCAPSTPGDWPNTVYGYGRMDLWMAYTGHLGQWQYLPLIFH